MEGNNSSVIVDSAKSHSWIKAICVVKFDHELGMIVEKTAPTSALTEQETKSVAMLSFPESNCSEAEWEHAFFYRFRRSTETSPTDPSEWSVQEFLFGYAYYIQRKDSTHPRGYTQKSFVIITPFYFSAFYLHLVQLIGKAYFATNEAGLIQVLFLAVSQFV